MMSAGIGTLFRDAGLPQWYLAGTRWDADQVGAEIAAEARDDHEHDHCDEGQDVLFAFHG